MGRLLDLAKALAGEKSLSGAFGRWILAVSGQGDQIPGMQGEIDQTQIELDQTQADLNTAAAIVAVLLARNDIPDGTVKGQLATWDGTDYIATNQNLWASRLTWYVNATTGNDNNLGDAPTRALETFGEFQRRMRGTILIASYTVNITGDQAELPVDFDIGTGGFLDIVFAFTSGAPYTVAAFTDGNPNNTALADLLQTTELASSVDVVGKRIHFTTGAASNCTAWPAFAVTGFDDHTFELPQSFSFTKANGTWIPADPAPGDLFVVDTLPVVAKASFHIRRQSGQGFCFSVRNAQFGTLAAPIQDPIFSVEGWGYSVGCAWCTNGFQTSGYHVSDGFLKGSVIRGLSSPIDQARFIGCYGKGTFLFSDLVWWDSIVAHGSISCEAGELHLIGLSAVLNDVADAVANTLFVFNATCRTTISTNGEPNGFFLIRYPATYGINVPPGAVLAYTVKPVIVLPGGANYALLGATVLATAANIPAVEAASLTGIVAGMNGDLGE